jgi:hypothetical protein
MEKIIIMLRAMLLDVMGSALVAGEGILAIQREILNKGHDLVRLYAKDAAERIFVSEAVGEDEKARIRDIMSRAAVLAVGEEEVQRVLDKLMELGLVEEVPPPKEADPPATENSSDSLGSSEKPEE